MCVGTLRTEREKREQNMLFKFVGVARQINANESIVAAASNVQINYNFLSSSVSVAVFYSLFLLLLLIILYNDFILTSNRIIIIIYTSRSRLFNGHCLAVHSSGRRWARTKAKMMPAIRTRNEHRKYIKNEREYAAR